MIRRRNEAGGHNYFLTMLCDSVIDGWMPLAVKGGSAMIFDPLTGAKGLAETRRSDDGRMMVRLQLSPGESLLLKTFPGEVEAEKWNYVASTGDPVRIDRGWSISFPAGSPEIKETFETDTLTEWTRLPDSRVKVNSGTARYKVAVELADPSIADDWILDLGDVRESARVTVNGEDAGCAWAVPMRLNVGRYLRKGTNEIIIDVTNLPANRIADYERRGVKWRIFKDANIASVTNAKEFSFGDWEVQPSGLNSAVSLIPVSYK